MISFVVYQQAVPAKHRFSRTRLAKLATALARHVPTKLAGQVEVSFVSDEVIQRLNRMYRGHDKVTDVLSFGSTDHTLRTPAETLSPLGEVLIAYTQAVRQAEDGDIELELADLLVHGILHLMGYDHELAADAEAMFPLQDLLVGEIL